MLSAAHRRIPGYAEITAHVKIREITHEKAAEKNNKSQKPFQSYSNISYFHNSQSHLILITKGTGGMTSSILCDDCLRDIGLLGAVGVGVVASLEIFRSPT